MKTNPLILLLALALLTGCGKVETKQTPEEPTPAPAIVQTVQPTATPLPATPIPAPAIQPPRLTRHFLVARVSVQTPDGIEGITPGTELQKTGDGQYVYHGNPLLLGPGDVTTDEALAKSASAANAQMAAQSRVKAAGAASTPKSGTIQPIATPRATPAAVVLPVNPLERGEYGHTKAVIRRNRNIGQ